MRTCSRWRAMEIRTLTDLRKLIGDVHLADLATAQVAT
jgi:hypothetical protein